MTHEGVRYLIIRVPGNVSFGMPLDMSLDNSIPSLYHNYASIHGEMEFDEILIMRWYIVTSLSHYRCIMFSNGP